MFSYIPFGHSFIESFEQIKIQFTPDGRGFGNKRHIQRHLSNEAKKVAKKYMQFYWEKTNLKSRPSKKFELKVGRLHSLLFSFIPATRCKMLILLLHLINTLLVSFCKKMSSVEESGSIEGSEACGNWSAEKFARSILELEVVSSSVSNAFYICFFFSESSRNSEVRKVDSRKR